MISQVANIGCVGDVIHGPGTVAVAVDDGLVAGLEARQLAVRGVVVLRVQICCATPVVACSVRRLQPNDLSLHKHHMIS